MENQQGTLRRARRNFHIVPNDIYDMPPTLTTNAIVVYTCLQRYAGNDDTAFPSFDTLMAKCRIKSDKTLTKAINCLIEHDLLKKEIRYHKEGPKKGKRTSNLYTLYDPPIISEPVNFTDKKEVLTVKNTVDLTVKNTVDLTVKNTDKQDTINTEQNSLKNKTQLNSTKETVELSQVKSSTQIEPQNQDQEQQQRKKTRAEVETEVKTQIDYGYLKQDFPDEPILDEVVKILIDGLRSEKSYWTVGGEKIPTVEAQERLRNLDSEDIRGIVAQLQTTTKEIKKPGAYILTILYRFKDGQHAQYRSMYNSDIVNRRN